jgi:hypothetical protein
VRSNRRGYRRPEDGDGYLEFLAIAERQAARGSDLGHAVQKRVEAVGDGLLGWAWGTR